MDTVYPHLKRELLEKDISLEKLSKFVDRIEDKMSGSIPWMLTDIAAICVILGNTNYEYLFVQLDNNTNKLESQGKYGNV